MTLEELRDAVDAGRLTLLPVERALAGDGPRYTPREIAELSGARPRAPAARFSAALGIPYPDPDERILTDADLEAARRIKAFRDAGLPEDGHAAGGADDRDGDGADRRGQPRADRSAR